ncbi:MAG TPA: rhomboid family intramembrane serine protease [Vicinamibacterales bacterium]|nr:rhomboid family intramembrane serine protease [Vicinamibacterales bacterium]
MIPLKDVIPSRTRPVVTTMIVAINVLVFLLQLTLPPGDVERFIYTFGLVPAHFSVPSLFTSMFVHGGLGHVGGNLLYLWIFGDNVEDRLGHGRFIVFYLATGVVAALSQTAMDPESTVPMVGASGAVAGVMGGYFVLYPQSRVLTLFPFPVMLFEVPAIFFLGLWFVMQFLSGLGSLASAAGQGLPGGVAFWAHVMGFVAGVLLVRLMQRPERQRVEWWSP